MKQKLVITGAALALMLGGAGVASAAPMPSGPFASCTDAEKAGQSNIPKDSPWYAAELDRDKDGVACDAKDLDPAAAGVATDPPVTGADDTGLDDGTDDGTTTDGDDEADAAHDESPGHEHEDGGWGGDGGWDEDGDDDQVSVVPEGGAPTGDGSTEGRTGWWVGGGVLAALAAAGLAFRRRLAGLAGR